MVSGSGPRIRGSVSSFLRLACCNQRSSIHTYELELGPDMVPRPGDSEVECFSLYTVDEVLEALNQPLFKPNSAIVVVEFLVQYGILTEENESEYSEIVSHLYRKLEFPISIQTSV